MFFVSTNKEKKPIIYWKFGAAKFGNICYNGVVGYSPFFHKRKGAKNEKNNTSCLW